jgi:tetratricopeptide (TPR) repeat protein
VITTTGRFLVAAMVATAVLQAAAYDVCDSPEKSLARWDALVPWRKALDERRVADLEKHYGQLLSDYAKGKITDTDVLYAFRIFRLQGVAKERFHEDWIKAHPKSEAAHLAQAIYYISRGWAARGSEFAGKTADAQFRAMEQMFGKAKLALDAAVALSKRPTPEAALLLEILRNFGAAQEMGQQVYRDALKRDPKAVQLRVVYITNVEPRWGGSLGQIAKVAEEAAALPAAERRYVEYEANSAIGADYALHKDDAHAAQFLERAMPMCPGLGSASYQAIQVYTRTKNYPALVEAATRYIAADPGDGFGWATRGWAYTNTPDLKKAFHDYERAAQLDYAQGYEGLAWFYEGHGGMTPTDYRKAFELYMKAYEKGSPTAKERADKVRKGAHLP